MKSVFGEVYEDPIYTESGIEVDAIFGYKSVLDRIVNSAISMGTTNTLLGVVGQRACDIYFKK